MLILDEYQEAILWHTLVPCGPIPTAQDPQGVYPYESFCETAHRPVLRKLRFLVLENDFLRAVICPALGGKVYALHHKGSGRNCLYTYPVVRSTRGLPRQFYIGGGMEISFPISHTPVQLEEVCCQSKQTADRVYVWCGERELRFGMHWTVEYSLGESDHFLTQRTLFFNPSRQAHPWMSWSNAGVPARPDTEFHFPDGQVLRHDNQVKMINWKNEGPKRQSELDRMVGFFWRTMDCGAFGAFTPSLGAGLYHIADPSVMPGIKLWSDGVGKHEIWVNQWTVCDDQCLEIQAGPLVDQSVKDHLQPGQTRTHAEFWIPTDVPLDIYQLALPDPALLPEEDIPRFGWARPVETDLWEAVLAAHAVRDPELLPSAPGGEDNRWAPSGMDELGGALEWAASRAELREQGIWRFQLGAWKAGRDDIPGALSELTQSDDDRAHALAGRLFRRAKNDFRAAAACFRKIRSEIFAIHPQVVVERDLALAGLGEEGLAERARWLDRVSSLQDEWVVERRAALLIDQGHFEEAKKLLAATPFQFVHQRYARSRLWQRIREALGVREGDPPNWLGEDDLAEFGAYREYDEDQDSSAGLKAAEHTA